MPLPRFTRLLAAASLVTVVAACSGANPRYEYPDEKVARRAGGASSAYPTKESKESVLGGISLFGGGGKDQDTGGPGASGIGVNSFLWRASLDTLSFMPLASADPFGGVIITDWYAPPETPGERFKATVYILDRHLRADGIRVSIFKQRMYEGHWVDAAVDQATVSDIENKILTRARELRIASNPK